MYRNSLAIYQKQFPLFSIDRRLHDRVRITETREGSSFHTLFGCALCLGIVSRRKVYHEAIKYEKERNAGFLSPFGYSAVTVAAAVNAVCSMEVS